MENSDMEAAFYLAVAVHGFLAGQVTDTIETRVAADRAGWHHLIAGDIDALLEAVVEHGPSLAGPGERPDLVARARALVNNAASVSVTETLGLLDELGHLARIDWEDFLPLPVPDLAALPAIETLTDRGPDPA